MKKLEIIYTDKTKELIKAGEKVTKFEFYLLDLDLIGEQRDISIALIKVQRDPSDNITVLTKVLNIIEDMYTNEDYVVKYDKI